MILCNCLYCDNCQNHVQILTTESIFSESAPQIKALDRNLSAFSTLFAPGKSWDNVRSTAASYTESRLARLVRNKRLGFPVVEHWVCDFGARIQTNYFQHSHQFPVRMLRARISFLRVCSACFEIFLLQHEAADYAVLVVTNNAFFAMLFCNRESCEEIFI